MKMTDWFPYDEKPVHIGVYKVKPNFFLDDDWYSFWNGSKWLYLALSVKSANEDSLNPTKASGFKWRGLAEKPE